MGTHTEQHGHGGLSDGGCQWCLRGDAMVEGNGGWSACPLKAACNCCSVMCWFEWHVPCPRGARAVTALNIRAPRHVLSAVPCHICALPIHGRWWSLNGDGRYTVQRRWPLKLSHASITGERDSQKAGVLCMLQWARENGCKWDHICLQCMNMVRVYKYIDLGYLLEVSA